MTAAAEEIKECFPKTDVHEAVRDRIATWRGVGQQLEEADCGVAEILIDSFRVEQGNCVYHVEWSPTNEEFNNDHKQHFDDTPLIEQAFGRIWTAGRRELEWKFRTRLQATVSHNIYRLRPKWLFFEQSLFSSIISCDEIRSLWNDTFSPGFLLFLDVCDTVVVILSALVTGEEKASKFVYESNYVRRSFKALLKVV